jgi:MoaA/NifB/PqqE/SkfB family radical SAM enzyme
MFLTLSVNDWCNSKCKTCNIWKNDSEEKIKEQLTPQEYEKIFKNFSRIYWITITGGEPFLREDLVQIIQIIYKKTKPEFITIGTNGILTERIVSQTREILNKCKNLKLIINISLDGIGKQHDEIRGVRNNFNLAIKTFRELKNLNNPRLIVGVNTVISKFNVKNFPEIYDYIKTHLKPDSYICEVAENRAKLYNMKLKITPRTNEYKKALLFLINSFENESKEKKILEIVGILRIAFYKYLMNQYSLNNYEGIASAYIMHNGDVWVSYTKPYVIGNLRNVNYSFRKLWFSKKAENFRKMMDEGYRTMLANAFYTNILCNPSKFLRMWLISKFK